MFNINGPSGPVQRCERRVIQAFDKVTNKSKRQKQNTTARTEPKAELFKGCYVVFNGRTGKVSSYFLANLVEEHGGNVRRPGIKFARITHVIGSNLNGSKTHKLIQHGSKTHHVSADWILESVCTMVRQPEFGYHIQSSSKEATLLSSYIHANKNE